MDELLKRQFGRAVLAQFVAWGTSAILIGLLQLIPSPKISRALNEVLIFSSWLMFLCPLIGSFFLSSAIQNIWKKTGAILSFLLLVWAINIFLIGLFGSSNIKSLAERRKIEAELAKEPYYRAEGQRIDKDLSAIKTARQAEDYLAEILNGRTKQGEDRKLDDMRTQGFVRILENRRKVFGDKTTAKLDLLVHQYPGAEDLRDVCCIYGMILWEDTSAAVDAMVAAKKELLPEFKNEKFYERLYEYGLFTPYDNTGLSAPEREEMAKPLKIKLRALRNSSNAEFVDYLLADKRLENWAY